MQACLQGASLDPFYLKLSYKARTHIVGKLYIKRVQ